MNDLEMARRVAQAAEEWDGRAYFVGGCVRDALLARPCKDIDIEVHGLTPEQMEDMLGRLGRVKAMGKSFPLYSLRGYGLDIALPRAGKNRGEPAPFIGEREAARRRDFTVNALMKDVLTGDIFDFFGGVEDLERGILRHVDDDSFAEDPLRVLRAAQLAARLGFHIALKTMVLCRTLDLSQLPKERVWGETEKALLKADHPSVFFEALRDLQALDCWFPELRAPEVEWQACMQSLDDAAALRGEVERPMVLMLAALVEGMEEADGARFLNRLTNEHPLVRRVLRLSPCAGALRRAAGSRATLYRTNRIFDASSDPETLAVLALCGSGAERAHLRAFCRERLAGYRETMAQPAVTGSDLEAAGVAPDAQFGRWMAYAHDLRLAGVKREEALRRTLDFAKRAKEDL